MQDFINLFNFLKREIRCFRPPLIKDLLRSKAFANDFNFHFFSFLCVGFHLLSMGKKIKNGEATHVRRNYHLCAPNDEKC